MGGTLSSSVQYEMAGYVGMSLCCLYFVVCVYQLWVMNDAQAMPHDSGKTIQKIIICLLALFNALDCPQYWSFVQRSQEDLKLDEDSYSLHLFAIWLLFMAFALFTLLWQRLLQLPPKTQTILTWMTMSLLGGLLVLTVWLIVSIWIQGIQEFDFSSTTYRIFLWSRNACLLPLCFGFLAHGLLLYKNVRGALASPWPRQFWDPEMTKLNAVKAKVLKRIVIVVSACTLFWLMRLTMMIIWEIQTNYGVLDAQINFSGADKENQFLWQILSQIVPFFGVQAVIIYMISSSANNKNDAEEDTGCSLLKKGLLANSRTSFDDSKAPLASNEVTDSFDVGGSQKGTIL